MKRDEQTKEIRHSIKNAVNVAKRFSSMMTFKNIDKDTEYLA